MRRFFFPILVLFILAANVVGHSALERTEPEDGATVKESPAAVQLWFSEPIKVGLSTIEVRDVAGKQVDRRDLRAAEQTPALVRLSLPAKLAPGTYKVTWSAVAQDLHVGKGSFSFRLAP